MLGKGSGVAPSSVGLGEPITVVPRQEGWAREDRFCRHGLSGVTRRLRFEVPWFGIEEVQWVLQSLMDYSLLYIIIILNYIL